jgi:cytochrome c oxidase assembly factor CtaG
MKTAAVAALSIALTAAGTAAAADQSIQSVVGGPMLHPMAHPSTAWVFVLAGVMAAAYFGAIFKMKRRPRWWQVTCFGASLVVIAAVIAGPLDRFAWNRVFVAYIAEQILLYMLAAPLLLFGIPGWMLQPLLSKPGIRGVARFLSNPIIAFGGFTVIFAGIHYPFVCNMICHARPFFGGIRGALLAAGVLFWWPLLSPLSELTISRPRQLLYLFLLLVPMTAVAAPITLSESVIYTWLNGPPVWGLSPLLDQRMGGILMWVGQALIVMIAATAVFMRWVQEEGE